jgi:hypothetical protein
MNAPYEQVNAMANAICGMKPALDQPNQSSDVPSGLHQYQFISSNGLVIDCHLEYEKAFDGGSGPTSEPSYPERIELIYALLNGVDMSEVLCDKVKSLIEEEALCSMEMDKWNDEQGEAA